MGLLIKFILLICIASITNGNYIKDYEKEYQAWNIIEPRILCEGLADHMLIDDPSTCRAFFLCLNEIAIPRNCPVGMSFSPEISVCDLEGNVDCQEPTEPPTTTLNPICLGMDDFSMFDSHESCDAYYICFNEYPHQVFCTPPLVYNPLILDCDINDVVQCTDPTTTTQNPICIGEANGVSFNNEDSCAAFFICMYEIPVPRMCPIGFFYNNETRRCAFNIEHCFDDGFVPTTTLNPICIGVNDLTLLNNEESCESYFLCLDEMPIRWQCQEPFVFNPDKSECDLAENVNCVNPTEPPEPTTSNPICIGAADQTFINNPQWCDAYFLCINDVAVPANCPPGMFFNEDIDDCDDSDNVDCQDMTEEPTTPFNSICVDEENYTLIDSENLCGEYFICFNGNAIRAMCPPTLSFNPEINSCDRRENVDCEDPIPPNLMCVGKENGTRLNNIEFCASFFICVSEIAVSRFCPNGFYFNNATSQCVVNNNNCFDPDDMTTTEMNSICIGVEDKTFINNPESCAAYYFCLNELTFESRCPDPFYFNPDINECDIRENVDCTDEIITTTENPICVGIVDQSFVNDPNECAAYFMCINEIAIPRICPDGMHFNTYNKRCDEEEYVNCMEPTEPPETTMNPICQGALDWTVFNNDASCGAFYICLDEIPVKAMCPPSLSFNPDINECDRKSNVDCTDPITPNPVCIGIPDGISIYNPYSCSAFFFCIDNVAVNRFCPSGLYFDKDLGRCNDQDEVECEELTTPTYITTTYNTLCDDTPDGVLFDNTYSCTAYYLCLNGHAIPLNCPDPFYFNPDISECDHRINVEC